MGERPVSVAAGDSASVDDILAALIGSDVLDTFFLLPRIDQVNFLRWIGSTDDLEMRSRRTATFVSALAAAPLVPPESSDEPRDRRA